VLRHIEEHFRQPLTNPTLARFANVSERSLTRMFLYYQGVAPKHFLMQVRVRRATETDAGHTDLALRNCGKNGFPNRNYLTRVFTKITGTSSALFRKTHAPE